MQIILSKLAAILVVPIIFLGGLFHHVQPQSVGAVLPAATGLFETSLATPITSTATSMTLTANAVRGGGAISGYACFTLDEGQSSAEIACGTVSTTSVTSMTRGISYADGITSVTANKFSHRRGANVKITDFPILQILRSQNNGDTTFEATLKYATGVAPSTADDLADKGYVDSAVTAGGSDASTTVKGISKLSAAPVLSTNPIAVGDNDGRMFTQAQHDSLIAPFHFSTIFETAGRFGSNSQTATIAYNSFGALLDTTASANSFYQLLPFVGNTTNEELITGNPIFSTSLYFPTIGTDMAAFAGIAGNDMVTSNVTTYTKSHIGFKVVRASSGTISLFATQANGTTETASSALTTVAANDQLELMFKVNGSSSVDYYWRKNGGALSASTNLTTNMPTALGPFLNILVNNNTVATQDKLQILSASYQR